MASKIPQFLEDMLLKQYGEEELNKIIDGYSKNRKVTLRVNTIKTNSENIKKVLDENNIKYENVVWNENALILDEINESEIRKLSIYENGEIYLQSLSAMIPAIILAPKENENILDMCAAPGGKTTQISALSNNMSLITACEKNKIRADRLKYNIDKQGANRISILNEDARNLNECFSFDKILLDTPCSGSGTISLNDEKLEKYFTEELVNRSIKTQEILLKKAIQILKPGHEMVYSTCSILEEENEKGLIELIKDNKIEIIPINKEKFKTVQFLPTKIDGTLCICPSELYEGFFVAKIRKNDTNVIK